MGYGLRFSLSQLEILKNPWVRREYGLQEVWLRRSLTVDAVQANWSDFVRFFQLINLLTLIYSSATLFFFFFFNRKRVFIILLG